MTAFAGMAGIRIVRWQPGAESDDRVCALLEEAQRGDAVWDPECAVALDFVRCRTAIAPCFAIDLFVAAEGRAPVAFGLLKQFVSEAWIIEVYVAPEHRRRGTALQMFEHLVGEAALRGMNHVVIEFEAFRHWSRALARKAGFERAGMFAYPRSAETVEFWIRRLAAE